MSDAARGSGRGADPGADLDADLDAEPGADLDPSAGSAKTVAEQAPRKRSRRARVRRWLRISAVTLVVCFVALTAVSMVFNSLSKRPETLAPLSGSDVVVDGARVHYEKWGTSGPALLLVHGFMESTASWEQVATGLADRYTVYALDLAGSGYSQYTGRYTLDDQTALVRGFIRELRIDRPVLVGHSLGAAVIASVALQAPGEVTGVIFADGDGLPVRMPPRWLRSLFVASPYATSAYRIATGSRSLSGGLIRDMCGLTCPTATDEVVERWVRPLRQNAFETALKQSSRNPPIGLPPARIAALRVPRAIIWGGLDEGGWLAGARTNLGHPPEVIIPGAGHLSMLGDPNAFAAAVDRLAAAMR